jgi:hypothetical protein
MSKLHFIKDGNTYYNIFEIANIELENDSCYVYLKDGTNIKIESHQRIEKIKKAMKVI